MRFFIRLTLALTFFHLTAAKAADSCLFTNIVAVGASVTSGTPEKIPFYPIIAEGIEAYGKFYGEKPILKNYKSPLDHHLINGSYGPSPIKLLAKHYTTFLSHPRITNFSVAFHRSFEDSGSQQFLKLIYGENRSAFDSASLIIGFDAFYWDAIGQNCGFGFSSGAEGVIVRLIQQAKLRHVPLILGKVPLENPANVRIDSDQTGVDGVWWQPDPKCAKSINATLDRVCTPENGCYILDVNEIVAKVNCGEKLPLKDGTAWDLFNIRPDGVHLSVYGARYIAEQLEDIIETNHVTCPKL